MGRVRRLKKTLIAWINLSLGALFFALSLVLFLTPASLVTGGVSGIAILLEQFLPLGVGGIFLLLNIPILLVGIWVFGKKFMVSTLYATLLSSALTEVLALVALPYLPLTSDPILAALFGGILCGAGLGLVLRGGGTTGGTDIGVRLLRLCFPHLREGLLFFLIDASVVTASAFVFRSFESALYSTLALIACSKAVDAILYGNMEERLVIIISKMPEALGNKLMQDCGVGVTYLEGIGGYFGEHRRVILCALRAKQYPKIAATVSDTDPYAFTVVTTAKEIYGEGFLRYPEKIRQKKKRFLKKRRKTKKK